MALPKWRGTTGSQLWNFLRTYLPLDEQKAPIAPPGRARIGLASRSKKREGSGLGLAIVRRSIEMLGGTVAVISTVGQGSTFTVRLSSTPPGKVPAEPS